MPPNSNAKRKVAHDEVDPKNILTEKRIRTLTEKVRESADAYKRAGKKVDSQSDMEMFSDEDVSADEIPDTSEPPSETVSTHEISSDSEEEVQEIQVRICL